MTCTECLNREHHCLVEYRDLPTLFLHVEGSPVSLALETRHNVKMKSLFLPVISNLKFGFLSCKHAFEQRQNHVCI